ncbi:MAG: winged helix-turn-helix domain-containing protein, partial [Halobacteria archaeon]|nr:winged helix-turn-helix domain-containing protein [Halobacteria archaeon]
MNSVDVYRCKSCDGLHLVSSEAAEKRCCGENLRSVNEDEVETEVMDPESEKVLKNVFGIGKTGLRICFCVIENEGATISEVADEMGLDRSAVSRHMND